MIVKQAPKQALPLPKSLLLFFLALKKRGKRKKPSRKHPASEKALFMVDGVDMGIQQPNRRIPISPLRYRATTRRRVTVAPSERTITK